MNAPPNRILFSPFFLPSNNRNVNDPLPELLQLHSHTSKTRSRHAQSGSQNKGNANQTKEIRDGRSDNDPTICAPCVNKETLKGLKKSHRFACPAACRSDVRSHDVYLSWLGPSQHHVGESCCGQGSHGHHEPGQRPALVGLSAPGNAGHHTGTETLGGTEGSSGTLGDPLAEPCHTLRGC